MNPAVILFVTFFVLLFLNIPIAVALAASSIVTMMSANLPLTFVATNLYAAAYKTVLLAIPFFILGGNIMEKSGISERLINFFRSLVGHTKHGIAMVCVIVACFFAAISGSGPATVAALGATLIPAMTKVGYEKATGAAMMSTAGAIGIVIPPSITFVVYGSVTGTSIGSLFMSGIIPGILIGIAIYFTMKITSKGRVLETYPKASAKERLASFSEAIWGILMPVIILGGIYSGIFTPTEAAAVAAVYGFFVGLVIYRSLKLSDIMPILKDSISQTAVVMFIIGAAAVFGNTLTITGVAASKCSIDNNFRRKQIYLPCNDQHYFADCGLLLDANSALYILCPILFPVAMRLGINPIHLGAVMVVNLAIGLVTPPVGANLFVGCGIAGIQLKDMIVKIWPFVVACILVLLLITYVPFISMFLPNLMS